MQLVDTHTHLYLPEFDRDRDEAVRRAIDRGITSFFLPNIDSSSVQPMMKLTERYPANCFPMMGLHPGSVKQDFTTEMDRVEKELKQNTWYAIGEVGIDLYRNKTYEKEQAEAFRRQVELALEQDLPLVIHSRNSFGLIAGILDDYRDPRLRGVFHCFSGNREQARRALSLGFMLGIGGIVTFRTPELAEVVKETGLDHILLETDSPYLAPVPKRGKRNESAYLRFTAEKVAGIMDCALAEVAKVTTVNALRLFKLPSR